MSSVVRYRKVVAFYGIAAVLVNTCWLCVYHGYWVFAIYAAVSAVVYIYLTARVTVPNGYMAFVTDHCGSVIELGAGKHWVIPLFSTLFTIWSERDNRYKHLFHRKQNTIAVATHEDDTLGHVDARMLVAYTVSDAERFVATTKTEYDLARYILYKTPIGMITPCATAHGVVRITIPEIVSNRAIQPARRVCTNDKCLVAKQTVAQYIEHNKATIEQDMGVAVTHVAIDYRTESVKDDSSVTDDTENLRGHGRINKRIPLLRQDAKASLFT